MNFRDPLELLLITALCVIAWAAVPVMWLFVGPLLIANLVDGWLSS